MKYVIGVIFLLTSSFSWGDSTGSLFLAGYIPLHFDLRVQPDMNNLGNIDLENGETNLKVADVLEVSNITAGYTISLESVNAGVLLHNNGTNSVNYQIQYGTGGAAVTPGAVGSPVLVKSSGALVGLTFTIEEVFFNTPANASLMGGAYTDTLIFSMQGL